MFLEINEQNIIDLAQASKEQAIYEFLVLWEIKTTYDNKSEKSLSETVLKMLETPIVLELENSSPSKTRRSSLFKKDPFTQLLTEIKKQPSKQDLKLLLINNKSNIEKTKYDFISEYIFNEKWENNEVIADSKKKGSKIKYIFGRGSKGDKNIISNKSKSRLISLITTP